MENPSQRPGWTAYLPGLIALAVVLASSAWIVWALNAPIHWTARILHVLGACFIAVLAGGAVGVATINVFAALAMPALVTEGLILGVRSHGWPGAVVGILAGFLLTPFFAIAATVLFTALVFGLGKAHSSSGQEPGQAGHADAASRGPQAPARTDQPSG